MKFISKLYFNIFKKQGNIRLLFVVSSLFAVCSLVFIIASQNIYYKKFDKDSDLKYIISNVDNVHSYSSDFRYYKSEDVSKIQRFCIYRLCEKNPEIALYTALKWTGNLDIIDEKPWEKYSEVKDRAEKLCNKATDEVEEVLTVYSFSDLWNLLWVIFWFYLPFIVILPIKFVFDGYAKDKK